MMINVGFWSTRPGTSKELKDLYGGIRFVFDLHPREVEGVRSLALEVKTGIDTIDPFIQEITAEVCPTCKSSNCINANGRFEWCDLIFLSAMGIELPHFRDGLGDEDPCQFLAEKGCFLPRTIRPYRCNWWYCDPLLEAFNRWRPRKQRMFISLMQNITQTRFRMCNQFKEIHTVVSRMASNRSLKPTILQKKSF